MSRPPSPRAVPPPPAWPGGRTPARTVQRAGAEAVFAAHTRVLRPPPRAVAEELVARPGGAFNVRSADRHTMSPPTGTFNFVRVHGDTPRSRPLLVSAKLGHAQIAGGRPVVYAGTARFDSGEMAWWSNYSGTYQPIAAFRAQAGLPENKFVPWQKLQMGGTAMQRGVFGERRGAGPPARPGAAEGAAADKGSATRPGVAATEAKAQTDGGRGSGAAGGAGQTTKPGSAGGGS